MQKPKLPPGFNGCFGHRGAAGLCPENTLASFELAHSLGADVLETDARITRDGHFVLFHDATLERTTDGEGLVSSLTLAEILQLDAGAKFLDSDGQPLMKGLGFRVPTLEAVMKTFGSARFNIELKGEDPAIAEAFGEALLRCGARDRVVLAAEDGAVMNAIRKHISWAPTGTSAPEVFAFVSQLATDEPVEPLLGCALQVPHWFGEIEVVTQRFVDQAHRDGLAVHVWTINSPVEMQQLLSLGVDGIFTDHPERWRTLNTLRTYA
ncbi:MAG: glycerophosphodiester phosphodiesterase [Deltaproteobacteria bacterium]|nr:glycerophosphodiester phosphodiesterase [Deltaproteobacteria bacterium]